LTKQNAITPLLMKIKKRHLRIAAIALAVLAIVLIVLYFAWRNGAINPGRGIYSVNDGSLSYSQDRGKPDYSIRLLSQNGTFDIYAVDYQSRSFLGEPARVYGLLFMPSTKNDVPGLVLLPGGGVSKENEADRGAAIAGMGYAVLTIDQRGIGQTDGYYPSLQQDYDVFSQGGEPVQHLAVFDALRAFDVMREIKGIDHNNIAIAGESMGGRYALIAAAIEPRLRGFIGISTAGFHFVKDSASPYSDFMSSIDPDNYIGRISPRPVFMFHGTNDTNIPMQDARLTFGMAGEPKEFFVAGGCGHGYCAAMHDNLKEALGKIFSR
jgi:fermentation-respiration switch protein FrsA (DUF1100 family)